MNEGKLNRNILRSIKSCCDYTGCSFVSIGKQKTLANKKKKCGTPVAVATVAGAFSGPKICLKALAPIKFNAVGFVFPSLS